MKIYLFIYSILFGAAIPAAAFNSFN